MKTARKVLLLALCAALLVTATVMGTLAYLTATTNEVTNTFTVGNVQFDKDLNGGLDEAKVNMYGKPMKGEDIVADVKDADRQTSNEYRLVPGGEYTKDPTIHLPADNEKCYLVIKVNNGISDIESTDATYKNIDAQIKAHGWKAVTGKDGYYIMTVDATTTKVDKAIFDNFAIKSDVSAETLANYKTAKITVIACAVQFEGVSETTAVEQAEAAWANA